MKLVLLFFGFLWGSNLMAEANYPDFVQEMGSVTEKFAYLKKLERVRDLKNLIVEQAVEENLSLEDSEIVIEPDGDDLQGFVVYKNGRICKFNEGASYMDSTLTYADEIFECVEM